jgi:cytoskeleton protein RodZ
LGEERPLTVGQFLREEREKRSISLETISKSTRITIKNLESLEKDDFQAFSAPIFLKSFLRSYAQAIGLDPHQVIAMYESKTEILEDSGFSKGESAAAQTGNLFKYVIPIVIIVVAAIIILFAVFRKPAAPPPPPRPPETSAPPKEQPAPAVKTPPAREEKPSPVSPVPAPVKAELPPVKAESPSVKTEPPPEKAQPKPAPPSASESAGKKKALKHMLTVKASETLWLRIQIDDRPSIDALLKPEETATWAAGRRFEILLGNAGGAELSLDGVPQGRLGGSGEVVRLILPKE